MIQTKLILYLTIIVLCVGCSSNQNKDKCYLGVMLNDTTLPLPNFHVNPHIIGYQVDWSSDPQQILNQTILNHLAIPYIKWHPQFWDNSLDISLISILNGEWDSYLSSWAAAIMEIEYPVMIAFAPEVNNASYPWHLTQNPKSGDDYIASYQYIVNYFREYGAYNVFWVWEVTSQPSPLTEWNQIKNAYPGDSYVDWVSIVAKNMGSTTQWSQWQPLELIVGPFIQEIYQQYKHPIALSIDTVNQGGNASQWIHTIPIQLQSSLSMVKMIMIAQNHYKNIQDQPIFNANIDQFQTVTPDPTTLKPLLFQKKQSIVMPKAIQQGAYHWQGESDFNGQIQYDLQKNTMKVSIWLQDDQIQSRITTDDNVILGDSIELLVNQNQWAINITNSTILWDLKNHQAIPKAQITYNKVDTTTHIKVTFPLDTPLETLKLKFHDFDDDGYTQITF